MNYPIWDLPAAGLLIALVAIVHVFISHFAVGGGFFLVCLEKKARREDDDGLLEYVRNHSRFFALLTLVGGAITGVGIWFTIGLVNPQATSILIQTFVWVWAIEWTFFAAEIVAALVYYYGWKRLSPDVHVRVGWVYLVSAWMSLFAINGILTFMLTPGDWISTRSLMDGFFNPTFWPGVLSRTLVAIGLAGLYAFLTASKLSNPELRGRIVRYSSVRWVLPSAVLLPIALYWYLWAAGNAGIPVAAILGTEDIMPISLLQGFFSAPSTGYPLAQTAVLISIGAAVLVLVGALYFGLFRPRRMRFGSSLLLLFCGLFAFGGGEWLREDLRKPFVLYDQVFVNGVFLPVRFPLESSTENASSLFSVSRLNESGMLQSALWVDPGLKQVGGASESEVLAKGRTLFQTLCFSCHTLDGHLAIRPLVAGQSADSIETVLKRLALPVRASGVQTSWDDPSAQLATWRNRRMPPFVGTAEELDCLVTYLSTLNGGPGEPVESSLGEQIFQERCVFCHGPEADWAMTSLVPGEDTAFFFEKIGNLPIVNPIMPPFEGSESERLALAEYLSTWVARAALEDK